MPETDTPIPQDEYSRLLRGANDNPGALHGHSTINRQDFYGNAETWVVHTAVHDGGDCLVFLQRVGADGSTRIVLPPEVTRALARQRDQISEQAKRRGGHRLIALRKQRGDVLGNAAALAKARKARKAAKK